jgi:hypothetical protein
MKKSLIVLFVFISTGLFAQTKEIDPNCYQKYAIVFEERGAEQVADGVYDDVIITFRYGSSADCFYGKVTVAEGKIVTKDIHIKFQDGTYEHVKKTYKHDFPVTIVNGISKTLVTVEDELINVMFVKKIKPKKKAYERAPEPSFD